MTRYWLTLCVLFLLMTGAAFAQDDDTETPTPEPEATEEPAANPTVAPVVPVSEPVELEPVTPFVEGDPRLETCSAPTRDDFFPYTVRPGERLADLLIGVDDFTVTEVAALNCIADPTTLAYGSVVWLPVAANELLVDVAFTPDDIDPDEDRAGVLTLTVDGADETGIVLNEEGTSFTWDAVGTAAYFYTCPPVLLEAEAECQRPDTAPPLPVQYTTPVLDGFPYAGPMTYRLEVVDGEESDTLDVVVNVACSNAALMVTNTFERCPSQPPLTVFAAWQPFENGFMMWFSDEGNIYVMNNDGTLQIFTDPFVEGMPDPDVEAPEGLRTPVRGFGQVWLALGGPDDSGLGFARSTEVGYDSARQPADEDSFTTFIQGPGDVVYAVTLFPGTNEGIWTQVAG